VAQAHAPPVLLPQLLIPTPTSVAALNAASARVKPECLQMEGLTTCKMSIDLMLHQVFQPINLHNHEQHPYSATNGQLCPHINTNQWLAPTAKTGISSHYLLFCKKFTEPATAQVKVGKAAIMILKSSVAKK